MRKEAHIERGCLNMSSEAPWPLTHHQTTPYLMDAAQTKQIAEGNLFM